MTKHSSSQCSRHLCLSQSIPSPLISVTLKSAPLPMPAVLIGSPVIVTPFHIPVPIPATCTHQVWRQDITKAGPNPSINYPSRKWRHGDLLTFPLWYWQPRQSTTWRRKRGLHIEADTENQTWSHGETIVLLQFEALGPVNLKLHTWAFLQFNYRN